MFQSTQYIRLNEWQQQAISSIIFNNNYMLISESPTGGVLVDVNVNPDVVFKGLKEICRRNPEMVNMLTDFVIDLHTEKDEK